MKRSILLPVVALVFGALVVVYARESLRETERLVMAAAETEGRALLVADVPGRDVKQAVPLKRRRNDD